MQLDLTSPILKRYKVEVEDNKEGFRFRLVKKKDGRRSRWACYNQVAMLDNVAAVTAYYSGEGPKELTPLFATEVLALIAVGEEE